MLIGIIVFFGLSFLILIHEAGHFFAAKAFGLKVEEFGFGFPPRLWGRRRGETDYTLNWLPFGGFVRIAGENDLIQGNVAKLQALPENEQRRLFFSQGAWKRSIIILAGVGMNFIAGWLLLAAIFAIGTPQFLLISGVQSGSPAEVVGLKAGDVIKDFQKADAFVSFVDQRSGEEIGLTVVRDGLEMSVLVTPREVVKPGEGRIGVVLAEAGTPRLSPLAAFGQGFVETSRIFYLTAISFKDLLMSLVLHGAVPEGVAGPVGIFSIAQEAGKLGLIYLLQLLALISINLSFINLMPFPALDGGRFVLIIFEKLRGAPISVKTEAWINGLGFVFLMVLIFGITVNDILNLL